MEREDAYPLVLYLILWVFLLIDFGFGLWHGIIYIFLTLALFFNSLGKREIDWVMWIKIYIFLLVIGIVRWKIYGIRIPTAAVGKYMVY